MSSKTAKVKGVAEHQLVRSPHPWPPQSVLEPGLHHLWERTVVFDFHEVCVDWFSKFANFVNQTCPGANIDSAKHRYYVAGYDPNIEMTPDQYRDAFFQFARLARGGYGDLEPVPGIKDAMERIVKAGIEIEIWTWTPGAADTWKGFNAFSTGIAQQVTATLINKLGLPLDPTRQLRFMHPGAKKWEMAEEHIPLIVEDNPETAVGVGTTLAHAAILVPTSYNAGVVAPNVLRLDDRKELAPVVIDFFKKLDEAGVVL